MKPAQAKRLTAAIRQQLKRDRADLVEFASAVRALAAIGFEPRGRLISIRFPTKRRPDPTERWDSLPLDFSSAIASEC